MCTSLLSSYYPLRSYVVLRCIPPQQHSDDRAEGGRDCRYPYDDIPRLCHHPEMSSLSDMLDRASLLCGGTLWRDGQTQKNKRTAFSKLVLYEVCNMQLFYTCVCVHPHTCHSSTAAPYNQASTTSPLLVLSVAAGRRVTGDWVRDVWDVRSNRWSTLTTQSRSIHSAPSIPTTITTFWYQRNPALLSLRTVTIYYSSPHCIIVPPLHGVTVTDIHCL